MKAIFEIIPHPNPWKKFWIFLAGCATGVAGAVGAMLIKERTEVKDGCVIFRHEEKTEDESPVKKPTAASENTNSNEGQGKGSGADSSTEPDKDSKEHSA